MELAFFFALFLAFFLAMIYFSRYSSIELVGFFQAMPSPFFWLGKIVSQDEFFEAF